MHEFAPTFSCVGFHESEIKNHERKQSLKKHLPLLLVLGLSSSAALAAQTGAEFSQLYDLFYKWATGYFGRAIALIFLLVGVGVGIIRGSIMGAVGGVAAAMCLLVAPSVVEGSLTAII